MILGFAHLTVGAADPAAAVSRWTQAGWTVTERHPDVPSAKEKWRLTARRPELHELIILAGEPAIEIVAHETGSVAAPSRLAFGLEGLGILARDPSGERRFFTEGLGFADLGGERLVFNSQFPQWRVSIAVLPSADAPLDPPLDLEGLTCLAFYSTNPEGDGARLIAAGGREATEPFDVELGERRMTVRMLRSPEGTIIELVKVKRR